MPAQLHADPCTRPVVDLGAEVGEKMLDILEADIGADRMREESVQNLAVTVIHGCSLTGLDGKQSDGWRVPPP